MSEQEFLRQANGRARRRLFDGGDYLAFCEALDEATAAAGRKGPYYWETSAGGVANNYGSVTSSARAGVYTTPDGSVVTVVDRATVGGRSVPCIRHGGERAYCKWFREALLASGDAQADYSVALVNGSDGSFEVIEQFTAASDAEATAYAEHHYSEDDWFVLDAQGKNINGGDQS
jgi:hypothetical protein